MNFNGFHTLSWHSEDGLRMLSVRELCILLYRAQKVFIPCTLANFP